MTIEELNVLFDLRAELEWLNTAKAQLMDAATSTTAKLTGMPHGSGVTDKVGGLATEIADLDSQIEQITAKSDAEEAEPAGSRAFAIREHALCSGCASFALFRGKRLQKSPTQRRTR